MRITINTDKGYSSPWGFVARVIVMTLATLIAAYLLPGVEVKSIWTAVLTAIVIAVLNNFLRPILIVVTLPFTIVTMGLFLLVINALIILLASAIVTDFEVENFWYALLFSVLLTMLNYVLELPNRVLYRKNYKGPKEQDHDDEGYTPYEEVE